MKTIKKIYLALLFSFMYIPIAVMIVFSFNQSKSRTVFTGFTLKWYQILFQDELVLKALGVTLVLALVSAIVATILGTVAALGIYGMKKHTRSLVLNISYLPLVNPEIITGVSLMLLFVVGKNLSGLQIFGWPTLIIAHITFNLPYVILTVMPKLRQMDPHLYEAALDLGCTPVQAFFKVVIHELAPGIMSGFLMSITYSIDDFVISYFTSGTMQTLPITIYSMTRKKVSPEINALSTLIFGAVLLVLLGTNLYEERKEKAKRKEI
ncbi:ABC transporter permease [Ruminococcaceae bacterium OttesenSCG-928-N02]|nr:ABC transporter permease [Ruminococcaceae bacterium OttesenSCG-928-N02]